MARTYPLSLKYGQCLWHLEDPYSFSSLFLEDLHSGKREYLNHIQQLIDAIPKSLDPTSRFALKAQVTPPGHQRLRHSLRAALWWFLQSDRDFRRASNGLQYYLARQGRRVVLLGGDITVPFNESRLNWVHDPAPSPPHRMERTVTVPPSDSSTNSSDSSVSVPSATRAPIPNQCLCVRQVKTRRLPLLRVAHQELLSLQLSLRNAGEGGGDRLGEQPIGIQRLVLLSR